jgi:hypothetical protein
MLYSVKFNATDTQQGLYCSSIEIYRNETDQADGTVAFYISNNVTFDEVRQAGLTTAEDVIAYIKAKADDTVSNDPTIAERADMPFIEAPIVL